MGIENNQCMDYDKRLARFFDSSNEELEGDWDSLLYQRLRDLESRYMPVGAIAAGGMKQISRVYDTRVDRFVAMAQLLPDAPKDLYEPFLREACLTARLEHPNIISVYDIGLDNEEHPFFTMELKSGDSLADIIRKLKRGDEACMRVYSPEMLLEVFVKICDAIAYAHSQGVVHLDLKPSNIQLASFGEVTVCDWGLGRFIEIKSEQRSKLRLHVDLLNTIPPLGMARGTPGYMAPEQIERGEVVSYQTDVYALGAILCSMWTLTEPYLGQRDLNSILDDTLCMEEGKAFLSIEHAGLRSVIRKCLVREPEQRYATVEELRDEIRRYQSDFPTTAERAGLFRQLHLYYKRNRRVCRMLIGGTLLIALISTVFILVLYERDRRVHAARIAAIESEQLYQQEQDRFADVKREYSGALKFMHQQFSNVSNQSAPADEYIYNEMIRRLNVAKQLNPADTQSIATHAIILFILQRYNEAVEVFEAAPNWAWDLRELSMKYRAKKDDSQRLSAVDLAELIRELNARSLRPSTVSIIEQIVSYDLNRRVSLADRALVVKELISIYNPQWTDRIFEYVPETQHLTIGGANLWFLNRRQQIDLSLRPLHWLDLHTLELREVNLAGLTGLEGLSVARLDLRRLNGEFSADMFHRFKVLGEVVVSLGQMPEDVRRDVPSHVKVVERLDNK